MEEYVEYTIAIFANMQYRDVMQKYHKTTK